MLLSPLSPVTHRFLRRVSWSCYSVAIVVQEQDGVHIPPSAILMTCRQVRFSQRDEQPGHFIRSRARIITIFPLYLMKAASLSGGLGHFDGKKMATYFRISLSFHYLYATDDDIDIAGLYTHTGSRFHFFSPTSHIMFHELGHQKIYREDAEGVKPHCHATIVKIRWSCCIPASHLRAFFVMGLKMHDSMAVRSFITP